MSPILPVDCTYTVYRGVAAFAALRPEWNPLLARSAFNSIFLTWEWQRAWWDCLGTGDLVVVAFRAASGELVGIAPLFSVQTEAGWELQWVGCADVADYLDVIIAAGFEAEVYAALLRYLIGPEAPMWGSVQLCNLHESSLGYRLLPELAAASGLAAAATMADVAPYLALPPTFDEYLESLDKKQRHELRRKLGKIDREAANWRCFTVREQENLTGWVDHFIHLHRLASAGKNEFMTDQMSAFFHRLASDLAEAGWLQLAFIEIEGQLAATLLNFDYDGRIWVYNSGFDPQAFPSLSPGIVLNARLIEQAIQSGHGIYDFLRGDEVYKYRLGAIDARVMKVELSRLDAAGPA